MTYRTIIGLEVYVPLLTYTTPVRVAPNSLLKLREDGTMSVRR